MRNAHNIHTSMHYVANYIPVYVMPKKDQVKIDVTSTKNVGSDYENSFLMNAGPPQSPLQWREREMMNK